MTSQRQWQELSSNEQLQLREAFGHYLDRLPASCSMESKIARFQAWLAQRGVVFERDDIKR
jgi:hypothetical protein